MPPPAPAEQFTLKPSTVSALHDGLWMVVNAAGTGGRGRLAGRDVAGKTGTAQVISLQGGKAAKGRTDKDLRDHGWFVFFAPKDNPVLAGVIFAEHAEHGYLGAPIAKHIIATYYAKQEGQPLPVFPCQGSRWRRRQKKCLRRPCQSRSRRMLPPLPSRGRKGSRNEHARAAPLFPCRLGARRGAVCALRHGRSDDLQRHPELGAAALHLAALRARARHHRARRRAVNRLPDARRPVPPSLPGAARAARVRDAVRRRAGRGPAVDFARLLQSAALGVRAFGGRAGAREVLRREPPRAIRPWPTSRSRAAWRWCRWC